VFVNSSPKLFFTGSTRSLIGALILPHFSLFVKADSSIISNFPLTYTHAYTIYSMKEFPGLSFSDSTCPGTYIDLLARYRSILCIYVLYDYAYVMKVQNLDYFA